MRVARLIMHILCLSVFSALGVGAQEKVPASSVERPIVEGGESARQSEELVQQIANGERQAIAQLFLLDRMATEMAPQPGADDRGEARRQLPTIIEHSTELTKIDAELNQTLKAAYAAAVIDTSPAATETIVNLALQHWTVLLRRQAGEGFHTKVAGLISDPDCAGDIIGDQFLQQYFSALFDKSGGGADAAARAATALSNLARQSACLGDQQSAVLASHLYASYAELIAFLRLNGLDAATPYIAQAAAAPLLLFYDVEKYRGPNGPLARWFTEQREPLLEGVAAGRNPAIWHRLWLYDQRSGRMLGYRPAASPRDETEVNLSLFYSSIVSPENLGAYGCSFADMIGRGANARGYLCAGSSCQPAADGSLGPGLAGVSLGGRSGPGLRQIVENQISAICTGPSGTAGGSGGSAPGCGNAMNIGGGSWASNTVRCLSENVVQPGAEVMHCVAEASGRCTNPADKLMKELQDALLPGIKLGDCNYVSTGSGRAVKESDKKLADLDRQIADLNKEILEAGIDAAAEKVALDQARTKADDLYKELQTNPTPEKESAWHEANRKELEAMDKEAKANQKVSDLENKKEQAEKEKKKQTAEKNKQQQRCPPDAPECGANECTGMSESAAKTMECGQAATTPSTMDPFAPKPGGCDPLTCDDFDPKTPGSAALNHCFTELTADPSLAVNQQCWAVQCAKGQVAGLNTQGACECGDRGSDPAVAGGMPNFCEVALCGSETTASSQTEYGVWNMGSCGCGGAGGLASGGGAPRPEGPFQPPTAPTFLVTNPAMRDIAASTGNLP